MTRPEMYRRKISSVVLCWVNYNDSLGGKEDGEGRDRGQEMNRKLLVLKS